MAGVGGKQWTAALEAPCSGRDAELRGLKDLFHTCIERRSPRLVVITGPAGVGKSRLGWEFEKYVDGLADAVLWHRGRCLSYGEGVAFWALAEIVRQRFGIAEEDPTEVAAPKLKEGLVRYVKDEAERTSVGVRLSRLLGVPYASETKSVLSQDELFAGWRLFFERLAQVAPVCLVVEDAQWADAGLLGFFSHLVDWTRDLPVFVLLFARPGQASIDSGYGIGRNRSTLSLDPLDEASMALLVDALVPGMPKEAREVICARAQGIPLFAVETVRSLIDQGVVERDRTDSGRYRLVGELGELSVPESLHALLAARLDALPPTARTVVAEASVVGTTFPKDALLAVSSLAPDDVVSSLDELVGRDVLEMIADPLSPERGAYRFSQEMLRQVAYETLSKKDRKGRHLAVAAQLRQSFANDGEEIADAIARHYLDAAAAGPTDADVADITAEAARFLVRAAERAGRSGAPARAAQLYGDAARIAPSKEAPGLFEKAARASTDAGDFAAFLVHAQAARAGHLGQGAPRGAARAQSMEGRALQLLGRHGAARSALGEALEVLRDPPDADTVIALRNLATLEVFSGNAAEGHRLVTEALHLAQALGVSTELLGGLFLIRGIANAFAGRLVEAACELQQASRLAERAGDFGTLSRAQLNLADVLVRSDPEAAAEAARSAVGHSRRTGQRAWLAGAVENLAMALTESGEWVEAATLLQEALDVDHVEDVSCYAKAGWLAGMRGDLAGTRLAQEAVARYRGSEDLQEQATLGVLDATAALCAGDLAQALTHASAVLEKADALGIGSDTMRWAWPLAGRSARSLGERAALEHLVGIVDAYPPGHLPPILRAERQLVAALLAADAEAPHGPSVVAAVAGAVEALRDAGNPYQLAHGLIDLAEVSARAGAEGVDEALAEATDIAERLGCPPLAGRARAVVSRYAPAADAPAR